MGVQTQNNQENLSANFARQSLAQQEPTASNAVAAIQQKAQDAAMDQANITGADEYAGRQTGSIARSLEIEAEEKKRKDREILEHALQQSFENRRQGILDDLDRQIKDKKQELADVDTKITENKKEIANLSELQLLLISGDYDAANSEHRALAERDGKNPDANPEAILQSVNMKRDMAIEALNRLKTDRAEIVKDIDKLEKSQDLIFEATDAASLDAAIEKISKSGIRINIDKNLSFDDKIQVVEDQLHSDITAKDDLLKKDLNADIDITHLSTEEQVEFIMRKHSELGNRNLTRNTLENYASQLSNEAKEIIEHSEAKDLLTSDTSSLEDNTKMTVDSAVRENSFSVLTNG